MSINGDSPSKNQRKRQSKKDVVHLAFNVQNPEIRGIGNLIYGIAWISVFIFGVGLFSFIVSMATDEL